MTTANKVTICRILLIPFFVVQVLSYLDEGEEVYRLLALMAFALAAISDGIDGYIARRYKQRSELGAILDPLADKLLLVTGVVVLSLNSGEFLNRLPLWLATTILSRDILVVLGLIIVHYTVGRVEVRPHLTGKLATVLQMISVVWILLKWDFHWLQAIFLAAGLFTAISGIIYVVQGVRLLSASPSSAAKPNQGK